MTVVRARVWSLLGGGESNWLRYRNGEGAAKGHRRYSGDSGGSCGALRRTVSHVISEKNTVSRVESSESLLPTCRQSWWQ